MIFLYSPPNLESMSISLSECGRSTSREHSTETTLHDILTTVNVTAWNFDSFPVCGNSYSFHIEHY